MMEVKLVGKQSERASVPVSSPCVGICSTVFGDTVCRGCKRYAHEIIDWNRYDNEQKGLVEARLNELLGCVLSSKIRVTDPALLSRRLLDHRVRHSQYRDPACWVLDLLRTVSGQVGDPAQWGFELLDDWKKKTLRELYLRVDQEFFELSMAHYQRYLAP